MIQHKTFQIHHCQYMVCTTDTYCNCQLWYVCMYVWPKIYNRHTLSKKVTVYHETGWFHGSHETGQREGHGTNGMYGINV